jgi:DNA-binding NarL/FixJ family response regulator
MQERTAVVYDPHPLWLDALDQVLATIDVSVVGSTTSREQSRELLEEAQPDLFVTDLSASAIAEDTALVREVVAKYPAMKVIVLSDATQRESISAALQAGASAYVFKTADRRDLALAVRQAFELTVYIVQPDMIAPPAQEPAMVSEERRLEVGLTRREVEILGLVAQGYSNAVMARMLWVTEQTVKFHLSNIYRKLDVANRTEASRWAHAHGLVPMAVPSTV